jgi:hypothetical protein
VSAPSHERIEAELLVGFDPHVEATWRPILLEQVRMLQTAKSPQDFAAVHMDLLARFAARQTVADERHEQHVLRRAELQTLAQQRPKPLDAMREIGAKLQRDEDRDVRDSVLQHVARCIADGLAWRLLAADRRALTILGDRPRVGRLADGAGFEEELHQIEEHARLGQLAIHNDLTNCLREGDLTVFAANWPPTVVGLQEVKAGVDAALPARINARARRQSDRLAHKLQILRNNHDPSAGDGVGARILSLPITYHTHLDALAPMLEQARRRGYVDDVVADGVHVSVVDYGSMRDVQRLVKWQARDPIAAWGELPADRRIQGSSFVRRYEDRRSDHRTYQAIAPVSLFPVSPEDVVDVLLGRIDIVATYRFDAIEAAFAARGIHARCAGPATWNAQLLTATRGDVTVKVPPHLGHQLTQELTTLECLVDIVEALIDLTADGLSTDEIHMLFCDERRAWHGLVA